MLNKLFKSPQDQLIKLIERDKLADLKALSGKLSESDIEQSDALIKAVELVRTNFLEQLLPRYPETATKQAERLLKSALQQNESLKLITTLFKSGISPSTEIDNRPALIKTLELNDDQLMLHLNRFNQFGVQLKEHPELLQYAFNTGNISLIKFLIESGAEPDQGQLNSLNEETRIYTERLLSDKKLRDSWF